jgi:hypothetical protein
MRRSLVAFIAVVLGFGGATPVEAAQQGTKCRHQMEFTLSPGFSLTPNTGVRHGKGTITCDGPVDGKQPTGAGAVIDEGRYGTKDPDSCISGSEGDGVDTFEIPTADGILKIESYFTYDGIKPSTKGAMISADFQGTRYTGNIELTPVEGDCVTAPVTKLKGFGEGILHPHREVSKHP